MSSYKELLIQIEQLKAKAEEQRRKEIADVVAEIRRKMEEYGLTIDDLGLTAKRRRRKKASTPGAVKYVNEATGEVWSGKGRKPKWVVDALAQGKKLESFRVS